MFTQLSKCFQSLTAPEKEIAEFANSVDLGEVTLYEPRHLDLDFSILYIQYSFDLTLFF